MIYLYVNLVSWQFASQMPDVGTKFHCDSISLSVAASLMGFPLSRSSGVHGFQSREQNQNTLFLSSTKLEKNNEVVLPYWKSLDDIQLNDDIIEKLNKVQEVYIGISSPKQDKLAIMIQEKFPCVDIYCFGAAIYSPKYFQILDNLGLTWLGFMLTNPKRFLIKIHSTLRELIFLTLSATYRKSFAGFVRRM